MPVRHSFTSRLVEIDPDARIVTSHDVGALSGKDFLNITLLVVSACPVMVLDYRLHTAAQGRVRLVPPPALAGKLPIILGSLDAHPDGSLEPSSVAIEPCLCSVLGVQRHWNPLCLPLIWHPKLPSRIGSIVKAFLPHVTDNHEQYCTDGLRTLAAAVAAARSSR